MSEPQSIRLRAHRAISHLLGECQELWCDADAWRKHLVFEVLPVLPQYLSQFNVRSFTAFRLMDIMPRQAWLRSACFDEYFRLANSDPIVNSSRPKAAAN